MLAKWVNHKRLLLRQQGEEKQVDRWGSHGRSDRVCMQADQTKASTSYLVADKSCRARIRGRHFCTASALFSPIAPGEREKKTKQNRQSASSPQSRDYRRERKGSAQPKCFTADEAALPPQPLPIQN